MLSLHLELKIMNCEAIRTRSFCGISTQSPRSGLELEIMVITVINNANEQFWSNRRNLILKFRTENGYYTNCEAIESRSFGRGTETKTHSQVYSWK